MKNDEVIQWLMEGDHSIRYYVMTDLLNMPKDDPQVLLEKQKIMQQGMVPAILQKLRDSDDQKNLSKFYTAKYTGLVWQLIVLAEMGAQADMQIKQYCEYLFDHAQEPTDGGFAMNTSAKLGGGRLSEVIPCLTGNMVWIMIHFGYLDDPRLQKAIDWLTKYMRFNDGTIVDPQIPPYDRYEPCWGKHTCLMGVVKTLKGLSAIPVDRRSAKVNDTIDKAVEFLLIHHIHKRSHDLTRTSKPGWLKLSFPLMYQTDILEVADILTYLNVKDDRKNDALQIIHGKQNDDGRWNMEYTSNTDRLLIPMEKKGEPSRWITLRALRVLKRAHMIDL